jgi:very-short-patch-repair endonuclease
MGAESDRIRSGGAWELQRRQYGVVTHAQLLELGLSPRAIRHRLGNGRLHRLHRGVYAVGRPEVGRRGLWLAAVLACGPEALLSHGSAAVLWGIQKPVAGPIEVVVPPHRRRRQPRIRVRRRVDPAAAEPARWSPSYACAGAAAPTVLRVDESRTRKLRRTPRTDARRWSYRWAAEGIPVTGPIATLTDLAASAPTAEVEAAVNEADHWNLVDPESLRVGLDLLPRRPGAKRLRTLLDRATHVLTTTQLERRLLPIVEAAGLPLPEGQRQLGPHRVDFLWPRLGLVVETDSLKYHRTAFKQAADHRRDNANMRRGLTTLRFTHGHISFEPEYVRGELRATAAVLVHDRGQKAPLEGP